jgi:hypothetical protein
MLTSEEDDTSRLETLINSKAEINKNLNEKLVSKLKKTCASLLYPLTIIHVNNISTLE